jgi:malonyl-CoA/methylmalonyl-CoA synthetase
MNLTELFDLSLAGRRDQVGLEFDGREYTFGEIDARSNRMARLLLARGFQRGDRLCVQMANAVEMIDLYLACVKLGVLFVPINALYKEREVSHILHDAEPREFVEGVEAVEMAAQAARLDPERPRVVLDGDDPAAILYTSGTTGASKGAVLTHNNFAVNAVNLLSCWQITSTDRLLLVLPLFHVHGLGNGLHCWLLSGCRMRLEERFQHERAEQIFLDYRPTLFFGVPTIYVRLLELRPEIAASMRLFVSGSAPLAAPVLEEFRNKFGHVILERYGMTEALMIMSNPYTGERRPGTVGKPLPGVSAQVAADGELWVRGSNLFKGYWRCEEATREAWVEGWFRTGDIASRSEDGYYTLHGRRTDLIISGGFNIYPREIEELLAEQEGVAEAAVVGVPDRLRGEVPVAFIVPHGSGFDCAGLEQICREKLASFKTPRRFVVVDRLPRTALGKVQKHLLAEKLAGG